MIAVLASGDGSNFEALAQHFPKQICALICNVESAYVIERAKKHHIPYFLIPHKNFKTRAEHEKEVIHILSQFVGVKLVVLAGYMRVLSPFFFSKPLPLCINLHPAHLDQFKGADAYEYAVRHKYPSWGLSIHKVTQELDSGELLGACEFPLFPYESVSEVKARVKNLEHELLVSTVKRILNEKE